MKHAEWHQEKHDVPVCGTCCKLHIGIDEKHEIVTCELTTTEVADATIESVLVDQIDMCITDDADDGDLVSQVVLGKEGDAKIVVPPHKTAVVPVIKKWQRQRTATTAPIPITVSNEVQQVGQSMLTAFWAEVQRLSNANLHAAQIAWEQERVESETQYIEMCAALDQQDAEINALQTRCVEMSAAMQENENLIIDLCNQLAAMNERASSAEARAIEIGHRAADLDIVLSIEKNALATTLAQLNAAYAELATMREKTKAERDQAKQEISQAQKEAATLRGQIKSMFLAMGKAYPTVAHCQRSTIPTELYEQANVDDAVRAVSLSLLRDYALESPIKFMAAPARHEAPVKLTARELECLKWVMEGKSSWEISRIIMCSEATINFHASNFKKKFNVRTRQQAVVKAIKLGLIVPL
jgi:DNA-binding CsgD family transcriptional regulator